MDHNLKLLYLALLVSASITACKPDDDVAPTLPAPNEEELITTLRLTFTSSGGSQIREFLFTDLDGDGGNAPVITTDTLSNDSIYSVVVELLNESVSPPEDITAEVAAEPQDHQFFFQPNGANVVVAYNDADGNGNPIGLTTLWTIGAAGTGSITVTLRHELDKGAAGVRGGDITNAGGETDIEVSFPVVIE